VAAGVGPAARSGLAGLLAPAGLDPAIVNKLHGKISAILASADVKGASCRSVST
jgi:hypothetical protein